MGWCRICRMVVPHITGNSPKMIESSGSVERVRVSLGSPESRPYRVWSAIRRYKTDDINWLWSKQNNGRISRLGGEPPAWEIDDTDIELIESRGIGDADPNRLRRLHRGGLLPDGSHLSWADGKFILDGIPIDLPYRGLRKILGRRRGLGDINWRLLLLSVSLANKRFRTNHMEGTHGSEETIHPVILINGVPPEFGRNPWFHLARTRYPSGHPIGYTRKWFESSSWMREWNELGSTREQALRDDAVPTALHVKKGRLQLRVRRTASSWRKLELESHPEVWAKLVTWALSPTYSKSQKRLRCIQQGLFVDSDEQIISKEDINGIKMLSGIVNENSNVELNNGRKGGFRVTGSSGAVYLVIPGIGGHNTRFIVRGIGHRRQDEDVRGLPRWMQNDRPPICVVETPELRRLVIGDALSTIILALLDDLKSQQHIDTIRNFIREVRPRRAEDREVVEHRQAENLRFRLRNNMAHFRTRRYTEVFPRLWSVLLRLPLGERMTFTAMRRGAPNITFDDCGSEISTESQMERNVVYQMLEASGWQRDRDEEISRGLQRVYIRTGTGAQNLANQVEEFAEMLEPELTVNDRVRMVPRPAWTFFERDNPGICALLPGTDQRLD
ncbi:MAG: hypothetical protein VYB47_00985 [Candidatus Thermoplasmatota archaeon]|nr:hypothetical protein [Candidatus Thermoplasmatota archaeon]